MVISRITLLGWLHTGSRGANALLQVSDTQPPEPVKISHH
ncbi:hypothetical protein EDWATA_00756 [Edwardsiella tarda ATCC 23685]|uniref:Uncharacterized protein n=1 Tax=Edwardsiella tarda ATCC 23685 TaxID=500638 RepID=D4F212_EDWTA|nr:hypothetical protein EDWATA_00756 [Edwardsiella tarda ATCC 23685]